MANTVTNKIEGTDHSIASSLPRHTHSPYPNRYVSISGSSGNGKKNFISYVKNNTTEFSNSSKLIFEKTRILISVSGCKNMMIHRILIPNNCF